MKSSAKKNNAKDNVSREILINVLLAQGFAILPLFFQLTYLVAFNLVVSHCLANTNSSRRLGVSKYAY